MWPTHRGNVRNRLPDGITATLPAGTERYIHATEIDMSDG